MTVSRLQAALDVLDRADGLYALGGRAGLAPLLRDDLVRQSIVMGVASLDTWMHWAIARVDLTALPRGLASLDIPFGEIVAMAANTVDARRRGVHSRPAVKARNALQDRLLRMTFQSAREWERGFELLGVSKALSTIGAAMTPVESRSDIVQRLNALSHRRNQISHEGDLTRQLRPQAVRRNTISRQDVAADLGWIRSFLTSAESVT